MQLSGSPPDTAFLHPQAHQRAVKKVSKGGPVGFFFAAAVVLALRSDNHAGGGKFFRDFSTLMGEFSIWQCGMHS